MVKHIVVISNNPVIYDNIRDNLAESLALDYSILYIDSSLLNWQNILSEIPPIDLLFLDKPADTLPLHKINQLINLSGKKVSESETSLNKPLKLSAIITLINKTLKNRMLFCRVNQDLIYSERLSGIFSVDQSIPLTSKENEIFRALMLKESHSMTKEDLRDQVWKYHKDNQSTTIDTHIYKLKQKLPSGLLEIKQDSYCLELVN